MISRLALACAAAVCAAVPASAQDDGPPQALVDFLTEGARDHLTSAILPDGSQVPAETAEERALPIVPASLAVQTIERALLSAAMEVCSLDSNKLNFLPYMEVLRSSGRYSEKQIAYVALLHGYTMGYLGDDMDPAMCSPEFNASMEFEAANAPITTP